MQSLIKGRSLFVANNARHLIASSSLSSTTSHHVISSSLICNNNNNITNTLFNNQVRHGGKHLPVNLKGRRGWQKVIEAKKVRIMNNFLFFFRFLLKAFAQNQLLLTFIHHFINTTNYLISLWWNHKRNNQRTPGTLSHPSHTNNKYNLSIIIHRKKQS